MNAIHPSTANADLPESASTIISAARKLKSWELRDFVTEYQTYPSPGAAHIAARLASRYNSEKGYSYETQRQIADATGYTRNSVAQYLDEIESTGLWTIVYGKRGTATRYAPIATELSKAKMFIEFRLTGRLSALPFLKVPNFKRPAKSTGELKGFAKATNAAKKARDIREAAESAALEPAAVVAAVPAVSNTSAPEHEYEISAYTPDDMDDIPLADEPDFYEPMEADDPFMNRTLVDPTEHFVEPFTTTAPNAITTLPAVRENDDSCPF